MRVIQKIHGPNAMKLYNEQHSKAFRLALGVSFFGCRVNMISFRHVQLTLKLYVYLK